MSDASLALAYLEDAQQIVQPDRKWNSVRNAQNALVSVRAKRAEQPLTQPEQVELDARIGEIERGLSTYAPVNGAEAHR